MLYFNFQTAKLTRKFIFIETRKGNPGPIEQALIGTPVKDVKNPFNIARTVRSFDP
jgi:hypothetical protein